MPVRYADINRCCILIEVARQTNGFSPEVSFGTHFFQDLVEANIKYLALYPDEAGNRFDHEFLSQSANMLGTVSPDDLDLQDDIRLIHVPSAASGRHLQIAMDGESDEALAYLV